MNPWTREAMRLLSLFVDGYAPTGLARTLVEKYRTLDPEFDHADWTFVPAEDVDTVIARMERL